MNVLVKKNRSKPKYIATPTGFDHWVYRIPFFILFGLWNDPRPPGMVGQQGGLWHWDTLGVSHKYLFGSHQQKSACGEPPFSIRRVNWSSSSQEGLEAKRHWNNQAGIWPSAQQTHNKSDLRKDSEDLDHDGPNSRAQSQGHTYTYTYLNTKIGRVLSQR
jgi:hypothetical protein